MTDARREAAIEKAIETFWAAPGRSRAAICAAVRAAIEAYELRLHETQPAPAPSGMTEAVRTLARVVEELVNQSGALTCGITAFIERQRDIRSVHDALDKESDKKHRLVYDLVAAIRDLRAEAAAALAEQKAEIERLREQLRPGSLTERAPTEGAYLAACAALHRKDAEITTLRARLAAAEKVTAAIGAVRNLQKPHDRADEDPEEAGWQRKRDRLWNAVLTAHSAYDALVQEAPSNG